MTYTGRGAYPVELDLMDSDSLGELDDEYQNNELQHIPCTDFTKGMCRKGGDCKYAHQLTLEQLGVHTFCHKFQHSICTTADCKYVHATPHVQQMYYRSGRFLPDGFLDRLPRSSPILAFLARIGVTLEDQAPTRPETPATPETLEPPETLETLEEEVPLMPISESSDPAPPEQEEVEMEVADIPLPEEPPSSDGRRPAKRSWQSMEGAGNSSGDSAKRCYNCGGNVE